MVSQNSTVFRLAECARRFYFDVDGDRVHAAILDTPNTVEPERKRWILYLSNKASSEEATMQKHAVYFIV